MQRVNENFHFDVNILLILVGRFFSSIIREIIVIFVRLFSRYAASEKRTTLMLWQSTGLRNSKLMYKDMHARMPELQTYRLCLAASTNFILLA